jgi:hypothetical protein
MAEDDFADDPVTVTLTVNAERLVCGLFALVERGKLTNEQAQAVVSLLERLDDLHQEGAAAESN